MATVIGNGLGDKITVFKFKAKARYSRKQGHRQPFTEVEIKNIVMPGTGATEGSASPQHSAEKEEN